MTCMMFSSLRLTEKGTRIPLSDKAKKNPPKKPPTKKATKKATATKTAEAVMEPPKRIPLSMDEIIKMLFRLSDALTIRMINSLFKKNFPLDAEVVYITSEIHRFNPTADQIDNLFADMVLVINGEIFHMEFQTVNDKEILPRMFEYGFAISIREGKSHWLHTKDGVEMTYPNQYIIFIERNESLQEKELTMKVTLWDGDVKHYKVPFLCYWEETADTLEAKQLEPLLPLQVFNIRKSLDAIAQSNKSEKEKAQLTEEKLREVITIYTDITERVRDLTENKELLTLDNAEQMLRALHHLSAYLYNRYEGYNKIEREAIEMSETLWSFEKRRIEGRQEGRVEGKVEGRVELGKETAYAMFQDGEKIEKIRKYSKLPDMDLIELLRTLPQAIQQNYNLMATV